MKKIELTATSANHLANIAKEMQKDAFTELNNFQFCCEELHSLNSEVPLKLTLASHKEVYGDIVNNLDFISNLNSFIAYVREEIANLENQKNNILSLSYSTFMHEKYPDIEAKLQTSRTYINTVTEDQVLKSWPKEKQYKYYKAEAIASTYGKFIHKDGKFNVEREKFLNIQSKPIEVVQNTSGEITGTIKHSSPYTLEEVNNLYFTLQTCYREAQKELNSFKAQLKNEVEILNQKQIDEYNATSASLHNLDDMYRVKYTEYKQQAIKEISSRKIFIPDNLNEIYTIISNVASKSLNK